MLADTDPLWHIAAGDLMRSSHSIPLTDPWSFTAGGYRWLNISWAWDTAMSVAVEKLGWHGAVAINAIIVALTFALIYTACMVRSGSLVASLLATIVAITIMSVMLRPLQITNLMAALWILILGQVIRDIWPRKMLALLPLTMIIWVNCHGGFLLGFLLIGVFFLQALYFHHKQLAIALSLAGIGCVAAMLCNPYGIGILEAARRPLMTVANEFILEWQPLGASPGELLKHLYALFFILLVVGCRLPVSPAERWLSYFWLAMSVGSVRHFPVFAIISAPVFACALQSRLRLKAGLFIEALSFLYNRKPVALLAGVACLAAAYWLPGQAAARYFAQERIALPTLATETAFIQTHYPKARFLTHFNLGSIIAYETRGALPVFVDPRTETAFPPQLMRDYADFELQKPGWERIFERYNLDGAIVPNEGDETVAAKHSYFSGQKGWKTAFKGPRATVYIRSAK